METLQNARKMTMTWDSRQLSFFHFTSGVKTVSIEDMADHLYNTLVLLSNCFAPRRHSFKAGAVNEEGVDLDGREEHSSHEPIPTIPFFQ